MMYYVRCRCSAFTSAGNQGKISTGTISTTPDVLSEYIYSAENVLLPSFTSWMGLDIDEHVIAGNVVDSFELTADSGFLGLKVDSKAQTIIPDTLKDLDDLKMNEDYPLAWYDVNLHLRDKGSATPWGASTKISEDVKKVSFSIKNSISVTDGTTGLGESGCSISDT
jgi:hypothetical protein